MQLAQWQKSFGAKLFWLHIDLLTNSTYCSFGSLGNLFASVIRKTRQFSDNSGNHNIRIAYKNSYIVETQEIVVNGRFLTWFSMQCNKAINFNQKLTQTQSFFVNETKIFISSFRWLQFCRRFHFWSTQSRKGYKIKFYDKCIGNQCRISLHWRKFYFWVGSKEWDSNWPLRKLGFLLVRIKIKLEALM